MSAQAFAPGDVNDYSSPLDVAFAHLAVEETKGHPNRGKMVDRYIKWVGLDPARPRLGYHWCCAAVVYWCHHGGVLWVPKTGSVKRLWDLTSDMRSDEPRVGDAGVHLRPDGTGHIFLVAAFDRREVATVEGNSNELGSRTGNAVVRGKRSRKDGYIRGYIRLNKERLLRPAYS